MSSLKSIVDDVQRHVAALIIVFTIGPLILLLGSIGVAEIINDMYGTPYGWFAVAGVYTASLIIFLVIYHLLGRRSSGEVGQSGQAKSHNKTHTIVRDTHEEQSFTQQDAEQYLLLAEQKIRENPLTTLALSSIFGVLIGSNPKITHDMIEKYTSQ